MLPGKVPALCLPSISRDTRAAILIFSQKACKSSSSQAWLNRHVSDHFVKMSKYDGYRARSAYKLIEIDDKFRILKPGLKALDCGAAPGSWTQVLVERIVNSDPKACGKVVAVDKLGFSPVDGAKILAQCDFTLPETKRKILEAFDVNVSNSKIDLVLSDMAPNTTSDSDTNHRRIVTLVYNCLKFAVEILDEKSTSSSFLCKLWDGSETKNLIKDLKLLFAKVDTIKPDSSRDESSELFVLARNFLGLRK
uniref:rRNA methyltransferase 2, mitochondrial n=1 Tax=Romanomermis culicivorax TaxID=13658 RepID=A0A915KN07_ROMCU